MYSTSFHEKARSAFPTGLQQASDVHFSLDALLLACFAPTAERAVDLGTGCGIVGLGMLLLGTVNTVFGFDSDAEQSEAARHNANTLGFADAFSVETLDIETSSLPRERAPLVVCNPPWRLRGSERLPAAPRRQRALYGTPETLRVFTTAATRWLEPSGSLCMLTGAYRLADMLAAMADCQVHPARLFCVHPHPGTPAVFTLVEGRYRAKARLSVEPPLCLYPSTDSRLYTAEASDFCPWLNPSGKTTVDLPPESLYTAANTD